MCNILFDLNILSIKYISAPLGLVCGIFIGIVAAALTETLDILYIASSSLNLAKYLYLIVWVIILGKLIGSSLYFIIF